MSSQELILCFWALCRSEAENARVVVTDFFLNLVLVYFITLHLLASSCTKVSRWNHAGLRTLDAKSHDGRSFLLIRALAAKLGSGFL